MVLQYFVSILQVFAIRVSVEIGSLQQLVPIVAAVIFSIVLFRYSKKNLSSKKQEKLMHALAWFISLTVIFYDIYRISSGQYNIQTDLPLYLCTFLGLTIPIFTHYKKQWMYEILLFWILGGTLQAIITPDVAKGFPSFMFFRYWIVHLGLVIIMLYASIVLDFKPRLKSVFKSILALQVYVVLMVVVNYALNANYFYLNEKPKSATLLDYFGEWPMYVIVGQLILVPYFLLIYLPFYLSKKVKLKHIK